jgi:hypothetical protein
MLPIQTPPEIERRFTRTGSEKGARSLAAIVGAVAMVAVLVLATASYFLLPYFNTQCLLGPNPNAGSQTEPVDIYCGYFRPPVPTGISDFGVVHEDGVWSAYRIDATQVVGKARIWSIASDNPGLGAAEYVAGLQLNTVLKISTLHGNQSYWVQNIAFFDTKDKYMNFANQIWNFTGSESGINATYIHGNGNVSGRAPETAYSMNMNLPSTYYTLPLHFDIITNATREAGGVTIDFAYRGYLIGFPLGRSVWDTVHIAASGVQDVSFEVNGFHTTGRSYYNTELVFTGPPGSHAITYSSLNASIGLLYYLPDGSTTHPHSLWEFGVTGESVTNLQTNLVNGNFTVGLGRADMSRDFLTD